MKNLIKLIFCFVLIVNIYLAAKNKSYGEKLVIYYFHGNYRCESCLLTERYAKEVIDSKFYKLLKTKKLEFYVINISNKKNEYFQSKYGLFNNTLVLSKIDNNKKELKWKKLDELVDMYNDELRFKQFLEKAILEYLE